MPLPTTHVQESLSVAYVSAIVARAGYLLWPQPPTEYGTDGLIQRIRHMPSGGFHATGDGVFIQIKATVNSEIRGRDIVYDMKVEAYNKLSIWEGDSPCILILCCLPDNIDHWVNHDEEKLILKRCCYWKHITDEPSGNDYEKRIVVPRSQVFDTNAVPLIFETFRKFKRVAV
jgi:hypothetical protein